jgi:hypothetical protein
LINSILQKPVKGLPVTVLAKYNLYMLVQCPFEIQQQNLTTPFQTIVSTDNPYTDAFLYITTFEGRFEIMVSLNMHAMNFKHFSKIA